jgi:hypothetical protein
MAAVLLASQCEVVGPSRDVIQTALLGSYAQTRVDGVDITQISPSTYAYHPKKGGRLCLFEGRYSHVVFYNYWSKTTQGDRPDSDTFYGT